MSIKFFIGFHKLIECEISIRSLYLFIFFYVIFQFLLINIFIYILNNYDIITVQLRFELGPTSKTLNFILLQFIGRSGFQNLGEDRAAH